MSAGNCSEPRRTAAEAHGRSASRARTPAVRLALIGWACLALLGCGFHLEGRTPLPQALRVACVQAANGQSDFVHGLRRALIIAGAQIADPCAKSAAVIHVLEDTVTPRVVAVSSTNLPREYEITYSVRFSVTVDGRDEMAPQQVSLTRDYTFDEHVVLAKENEDAILRGALAHDLVDIVMRRLSSL